MQAKKRNEGSFEPTIITIGETWKGKIEELQKKLFCARFQVLSYN